MVRCDKNADLILEIDAGIKKEISVGCAVEHICCSVCGNDQKTSPCSHTKGQVYSGVSCYHTLSNPTDAYEWSFVAVPAQKNAGVTKYFTTASTDIPSFISGKLSKIHEGASFTSSELTLLSRYIGQLKDLAGAGEEYTKELQKSIIRTASFAQPEMDLRLLEDICKTLDITQLKTMETSYKKMLENKTNIAPQTMPQKQDAEQSVEFKI